MIEVDILPHELELVRCILQKHLLTSTQVWAFGSRAHHTAKRFSDLDLAIDAGGPLSYETLVSLRQDFEESELPFKVDLVDWHRIDSTFQYHLAPYHTSKNALFP